MSEVAKFEHEQFGELRAVEIDGDTWFVAIDVCTTLGYADSHSAVKHNVSAGQSRTVPLAAPEAPGGFRRTIVLSEAGLYRLIMRSNLPTAIAFQDWIAEQVLPSIRKTGSYNALDATPQSFAEALELAAKQQREIETMAPRVELLELFEDKREGFSVADAGALFGYKPHQFHEIMRTWGATLRNSNKNIVASEFWVHKGWLKRRNAVTPAVTPMGLAEIERRLGRKAVG
jgi:prophage antirepressor-like protein